MLRSLERVFCLTRSFNKILQKYPRNTFNRYYSPNNTPKTLALSRLLENQIKYQNQNSTGSEALLNSIKKQGWTVQNQHTLIEMKKKIGDKTINVVFFAQPLHPEQQIPVDDETDKVESFGDYTEFTVYVQKQGNCKTMYADFYCNQDQIRLVKVNFTEDFSKHKLISKQNRDITKYLGPQIQTLEEKLKSNLDNYFQQLGINSYLVSFVQEYSRNSQHPLYLSWLTQFNQFLK